jgi:hypothetical protein
MFQGHENLVHRRQFRGISHDTHPEKGDGSAHIHTLHVPSSRTHGASWREERRLLAHLEHAVSDFCNGRNGQPVRASTDLVCKSTQLPSAYLLLVLWTSLWLDRFCWLLWDYNTAHFEYFYPFPIPTTWLFSLLPSVILVLCPKHINTLFRSIHSLSLPL